MAFLDAMDDIWYILANLSMYGQLGIKRFFLQLSYEDFRQNIRKIILISKLNFESKGRVKFLLFYTITTGLTVKFGIMVAIMLEKALKNSVSFHFKYPESFSE